MAQVKTTCFLQDTFRGRVCECPLVNGVQFQGDGYTSCDGNALADSCLISKQYVQDCRIEKSA